MCERGAFYLDIMSIDFHKLFYNPINLDNRKRYRSKYKYPSVSKTLIRGSKCPDARVFDGLNSMLSSINLHFTPM